MFQTINELKKIKSNKMDKTLKLSEKLFCLAVNPKNGGILLNASSALNMTLTGSVFVELMKKDLISNEKVFLMDRELVENIRKNIEITLLGKIYSNDDFIILSVMAAKSNLLSRIFPDRPRRKEAVLNLKNLPETDVSKAVQEAIQMAHAAVFLAAT